MLRTNDMRRMLISLFFLGTWFPSSATGGQILSELKEISGSPTADGEGRLMRFRTCHDEFMVQCEPCEAIRIVNASYAASQLNQRNPIQGCSEISFQQEFDCLHPAKRLYFEGIKGSCDGNQVCELRLDKDSVSCGSSRRTWSCCLEIYYTCKPKSDLIQTALFSANDLYGNVIDVSLQCHSSDLSLDSVMLAFNSSGEIHGGGDCYKVSPNINNLKRYCEGMECSGISVTGSKGCGRNEDVFNHGIYVCYMCKGDKVQQTIGVASQSAAFGQTRVRQTMSLNEAETTEFATATKSSSMLESSTTISITPISKWFIQVNMWVIVGASLGVGFLLFCLLVGHIVCIKRYKRRNGALGSSRSERIYQRKGAVPPRGSQASEKNQEDYSYPEMPPICLHLKDSGRGQNCKVCSHADSAESGSENEGNHLGKVDMKEQAKTVCEESLQVLHKGEVTNKFDSSCGSNQVTDSRIYLELVADHVDDDGVGKGLEQVNAKKKDFRKGLKPIVDVPKESNPDCVNSGICREETKITYQKLDLSHLTPVYEELNLSTMDENPVNIEK